MVSHAVQRDGLATGLSNTAYFTTMDGFTCQGLNFVVVLAAYLWVDVFLGPAAPSCPSKNASSAFRSNRLVAAWQLETIVSLNDVIQFLDKSVLLSLSLVGVIVRAQRK